MKLTVNRQVDKDAFRITEGAISLIIIETGERSNVCQLKPEPYVIDAQSEWSSIAERKLSVDCNGNKRDSPIPSKDLNNNTLIAYFWGQKPNSGNTFSIGRIEADAESSSVIISLKFTTEVLDTLSYPYIIATIPKTSYHKFVFEEHSNDLF
jgi:hypothetical protein